MNGETVLSQEISFSLRYTNRCCNFLRICKLVRCFIDFSIHWGWFQSVGKQGCYSARSDFLRQCKKKTVAKREITLCNGFFWSEWRDLKAKYNFEEFLFSCGNDDFTPLFWYGVLAVWRSFESVSGGLTGNLTGIWPSKLYAAWGIYIIWKNFFGNYCLLF